MDVEAIAKGLTEAQREAVLSMEWTGEYYNPPKRERPSLAKLGLLDADFSFAVTTIGEAVRNHLKGQQ